MARGLLKVAAAIGGGVLQTTGNAWLDQVRSDREARLRAIERGEDKAERDQVRGEQQFAEIGREARALTRHREELGQREKETTARREEAKASAAATADNRRLTLEEQQRHNKALEEAARGTAESRGRLSDKDYLEAVNNAHGISPDSYMGPAEIAEARTKAAAIVRAERPHLVSIYEDPAAQPKQPPGQVGAVEPPQTAAPESSGQTPQPKSEAEYNALPEGAQYLDPNGVPRTKGRRGT